MNLESVKEEAREILVEFTNAMCDAAALGKKIFWSIVHDAIRLNWLCGRMFCTTEILPLPTIKYGQLYNWYAATDVRNIAAVNAHLPSAAEFQILLDYLGGGSVASNKMRSTDSSMWLAFNQNATNLSGFTAIPSGYRAVSGGDSLFEGMYVSADYHLSDSVDSGHSKYYFTWASDTNAINTGQKTDGRAIRLLVTDPTLLTDGDVGEYTGNNGVVYSTVKIGTQIWTTQNLMESQYRNGNLIAIETDSAAWSILATGAMCAYDNNESHVNGIIDADIQYFSGDTLLAGSPTLGIEQIRHYRGKYKNVDLSQIGVVTNPSAPVETISDLLRSGSQAAVIGANAIVFSSPLSTENYTVNVWIIGNNESQYDLGDISRFPTGFTVSDVVIEGTLYYQAIKIV